VIVVTMEEDPDYLLEAVKPGRLAMSLRALPPIN
jgi:hypothetical protein